MLYYLRLFSHDKFLYHSGYCGIYVHGDAGCLGYAVIKLYFESSYNVCGYYEVLEVKSYEIGEDGKTHPKNAMIVEDIVAKDCAYEEYGKEYVDKLLENYYRETDN